MESTETIPVILNENQENTEDKKETTVGERKCSTQKIRKKRAVIDTPQRTNIGVDGSQSHEFK